ncbi:MAG: T9SS type A sorting domain-containing protein [Candidatus Eisenbacteria bacterium]|nr:T9SS type A sorting domain-containing protein [Candidatus Eisenbacteria bacterium]
MVIYWHLSDAYQISYGNTRANMYGVTAVPTVWFDGVYEQVGTSEAAYISYTNTRLAAPTPVEIESKGVINADGGWVDAKFRAVDSVPYGTMTARFVAIEETSQEYPWTAREVASPATVSLSAAGDTVVVSRNFNVTWAVQGDLDIVVFLEDTSPLEVVNAQIVPFAYNPSFASPDFAIEADYGDTTVHSATLTNSGAVPDTFTVTFSQDVLPANVTTSDWAGDYREAGGSWTTGPSTFALDPGESVDLEVRLIDNIGNTPGLGLSSLNAQSQGAAEATAVASFATFVDQRSILIVDDDGGQSLETHLQTALADTGLAARTWDADSLGRPTLGELSSYWAVLWTTGGSNCSQVSQADEAAMIDYLDQGGNLYLASADFLSSRSGATAFTTDYLHIDSWTSDMGGFSMAGVAGDPISDGMALGQSGGPVPTSAADRFTLLSGADVIFAAFGNPTGLKAEESGHKVVFTAFPFENVKTGTADPSNQKTLVSRILSWFEISTGADDQAVAWKGMSLEQNVPNPFNPVTQVAFTVPGGAERATVKVYDVRGRLVSVLFDGSVDGGRQVVRWDGRGPGGANAASGIYFVRLEANGERSERKMTLLK